MSLYFSFALAMTHQVAISSSAEEQLEFHKIRELLGSFTRGVHGRNLCLSLHPSTDIDYIRHNLDEVYEYTEISGLSNKIQLSNYEDVSVSVDYLAVEGYVLPQEDIHEIGRQLEQVHLIHRFFEKTDYRRDYRTIYEWTNQTVDPVKLIKQIRAILDDKGDVRHDASPELVAIARERDAEVSKLNREFLRLIAKYKAEGWITDTVESIRAGRRVLCVQSEHKRKVKGIVHDESTTGRTVFIEPDLIVDINNNIIEFEADYKKEVYRLLKELCASLRPSFEIIESACRLIKHWDVIQAMYLLGTNYKGLRPKIQEEATLHLIHARHPLLSIKNKSKGKDVIAFDLVLNQPNKLLVLSGPNAGGKSILMKATGLIQVMAQCGMLIPADGSTIIGMMKRISVDIGDQQSIEEDLSTYSSRLKNMKETLNTADESTLILVDEFGSGTDPKIGGAIAEAILDALVKKQAYGVLTTHYPNIKMYAHRTKGVVNGAMMFDKEKIQPTYQLKIGKPGSSFAFEIAERTGLPNDVIEYARKSAGSQTVEMEDLIHDLDSKTQKLDHEIKRIQDKQKELDRLVANYEQLRLDLEIKRKRFKIDQKKASLQEVSQYSQEMNKLMKDLRKEKDAEKAKEQIDRIKEKQTKYSSEIKSLADELIDASVPKKEFKAGDHVKLRSTQQIGVIDRISKDKAVIIIGQMQMTLPLHELLPANAPIEIQPHRSI
ncbi:MAG TPA: MutS2/Smr-associated SH3 domain-containing protein, partial [Saprospiraceae bacterium]|nr:MutS2/Smr-associated SH3 domain-containing protein [Saprospiraceae bacterium]